MIQSTALIIASNNGRTSHVQMLLENYKVDVNIKNKYGKSALMGASNKGHLDTVRVLLEHGYSLTHLTLLTHSPNLTCSLRACPNAQAKDGKASLMFACYRGKIDVVRLLLERGADPRCSLTSTHLLTHSPNHLLTHSITQVYEPKTVLHHYYGQHQEMDQIYCNCYLKMVGISMFKMKMVRQHY